MPTETAIKITRPKAIVVRFRLSSLDVLPRRIQGLIQNTNRVTGMVYPKKGVQTVPITPKCSASKLLSNLWEQGYEQINMSLACGKTDNGTHYVLRLDLVPYRDIESTEELHRFKIVRSILLKELGEFLANNMWSVQAFSNPFYKHWDEVPDERALSINFAARESLVEEGGFTKMVWGKGKSGKVPLEPERYVMLDEDGSVVLDQ